LIRKKLSNRILMDCVILLATKNGEKFLKEQLDSIQSQAYKDWIVYASDDNSKDNTLDILLSYQKKWGKKKLNIYQGPDQGSAKNFWSLIHRVKDKRIKYIAFCDQDDVWQTQHLQRGIDIVRKDSKTPQALGSRTQYINQEGKLLNFSPKFLKQPCFLNALVQNIAGGNTQIFNTSLLIYLQKVPLESPIFSHDWLVYQIATAIEGRFIYTEHPSIFYRQHNGNIVGRNDRCIDRIKRFKLLFKGRFRDWNTQNLACLQYIHNDISPKNKEVVKWFTHFRNQPFFIRLVNMNRLGLIRQTFRGQFSLYFGFLINKI